VREAITYVEREKDGHDFLKYIADGKTRSLGQWRHPHSVYEHCVGRFNRTIPSIHMPRWASRITLEVTGVRAERLQDITPDDVIAEGLAPSDVPGIGSDNALIDAFAQGWDKINKKRIQKTVKN